VGTEKAPGADKPRSAQEYAAKTRNLAALLPPEPPLFVGLQEIGDLADARALAQAVSERYGQGYEPLFVAGNDFTTRLDVGAIYNKSQGWAPAGKPGRAAELQRNLAKHLVVRLTNGPTALDLAVVSLREPKDAREFVAQIEQNRALARWAMRHLVRDPQARLAILGGFNETNPVGSEEQALTPLLDPQAGLTDVFSLQNGKVRTHIDGKTPDRIFLSAAVAKGEGALKFQRVDVNEHPQVSAADRRLFTDHYPIWVTLTPATNP
jgi:hypothetical protein